MPPLNTEFSNRFKSLIEKSGVRHQKDLAKILGVSDNAITNYVNKGRVPKGPILKKISEYFNVSMGWLLAGEGQNEPEAPILSDKELKNQGFIKIPFSTTMKLAAGNGGTTLNYIDVDEDADSSTIIIHGPTLGVHNANHLQAFRVDGDSMEPLIAQGGIVLVDKTVTRLDDDRFREGGIYMLCWEDDGLCAIKRVRWADRPTLLAIESANPNSPTIFKKPKEIHQLIGKIIWSWREH